MGKAERAKRDLKKKIMALIHHKAIDNNVQDSNGSTLLHIVLYCGLTKFVEPLLDNGANPNQTNKCLETPLHFAAAEGHLEEAKLLLERGAEPHARAHDGFTPWDLAKTTKIRSLLKKATKNMGGGQARPGAESAAAAAGAEEMRGKAEGNYRPTGLECLVFVCNLEACDNLLSRAVSIGEDPNANNAIGLPLLHSILSFYSKGRTEDLKEKIMVLIKHNAIGKNCKDERGLSLLHTVLRWGLNEFVKPLLDNSAEVDIRDNNSQTPLHVAAAMGNVPMVTLLLKRGADRCAQTKKGFIPFNVAKNRETQLLLAVSSI